VSDFYRVKGPPNVIPVEVSENSARGILVPEKSIKGGGACRVVSMHTILSLSLAS